MSVFHRLTIAILGITLMMAMPNWGWAQKAHPSAASIDSLTKLIAAANKIAHPNPDSIQVGDEVVIPTLTGYAFTKAEPWMFRSQGKHGCFWDIAAGYLAGTITPTFKYGPISQITPDLAPAPAQVNAFENLLNALQAAWNKIPWWIFFLFLLAVIGLTLGSFYLRRARRRERERQERVERERLAAREQEQAEARERERLAEEERRMDPRNDPPVIPGGLSEDPKRALEQAQSAVDLRYGPNQRRILRAEHGTLKITDDRKWVVCPVEHVGSEGIVMEPRRLKTGDKCCRLLVREESVESTEHWLRHCGNPVGEVKNDKLELPPGVEFVPDQNAVAERDPALDAIWHASSRLHEAAEAQKESNPDGKYEVEIIVTNGTGTPTTGKVISKGHRPPKSVKMGKEGRVEATF